MRKTCFLQAVIAEHCKQIYQTESPADWGFLIPLKLDACTLARNRQGGQKARIFHRKGAKFAKKTFKKTLRSLRLRGQSFPACPG